MEFSPGFQWTYALISDAAPHSIYWDAIPSPLFHQVTHVVPSRHVLRLCLLGESPAHFPGWHFAAVHCHSVETWETDRYAQHNRYLFLFTFVPDTIPYIRHWSKNHNSLVARKVKNLPAMWETRVQSLGQEDPLVKGMAIVFLPDNPMDRDSWWATVHGITKSWTCLSN